MNKTILSICNIFICATLILTSIIPVYAINPSNTPSISGKVESRNASSTMEQQMKESEKFKSDFAKNNKITLKYLNNVLSGSIKDTRIWEKFYNLKNQKNIDDILNKYHLEKSKIQTNNKGFQLSKNSDTSELSFLEQRVNVIQNTNTVDPTQNKMFAKISGSDDLTISNQYTKLMKQVSVLGCTQNSLLPIAYSPGDILVTSAGKNLPGPFNTWHAAIIIDRTSVAEAQGTGLLTRKSDLSKWCNIKGFTTLGFVNYGNSAIESRAANNAATWLQGRPYPNNAELQRDPWDISTVYCSGLVWRAYAQDVNIASYNRIGNLILPQNLIDDDNTLFLKYWAHN